MDKCDHILGSGVDGNAFHTRLYCVSDLITKRKLNPDACFDYDILFDFCPMCGKALTGGES